MYTANVLAGLVSFGSPFAGHTPSTLPAARGAAPPFIAPFWTDVDTRGSIPRNGYADPGIPNTLYYRVGGNVDGGSHSYTANRLRSEIAAFFPWEAPFVMRAAAVVT